MVHTLYLKKKLLHSWLTKKRKERKEKKKLHMCPRKMWRAYEKV